MSDHGPTNASADYQKLRDELLEAEIDLKEQCEKVAALRRELPADTPVEDYAIQVTDLGGHAGIREGRLSDLFEDPTKPLVLVHFMFGKKQSEPCPMCTMWADGYNGVVPHLRQRLNFAVLVAGDLAAFRRYAEGRGWRHLRLVSSAQSSLKTDFRFEAPDGSQMPGASVFALKGGKPVHTYSVCAMMGKGHFRGMDLLSPVWNFFDLMPEGRGDFMPKKRYES